MVSVCKLERSRTRNGKGDAVHTWGRTARCANHRCHVVKELGAVEASPYWMWRPEVSWTPQSRRIFGKVFEMAQKAPGLLRCRPH